MMRERHIFLLIEPEYLFRHNFQFYKNRGIKKFLLEVMTNRL